jgi:hypothetical protein
VTLSARPLQAQASLGSAGIMYGNYVRVRIERGTSSSDSTGLDDQDEVIWVPANAQGQPLVKDGSVAGSDLEWKGDWQSWYLKNQETKNAHDVFDMNRWQGGTFPPP